MPVDKFGRNGDNVSAVENEINLAILANSFLSGDGGYTVIWSFRYEYQYY